MDREIPIQMSADLLSKLEQIAEKYGKNLSQVVRDAVSAYDPSPKNYLTFSSTDGVLFTWDDQANTYTYRCRTSWTGTDGTSWHISTT